MFLYTMVVYLQYLYLYYLQRLYTMFVHIHVYV